MDECLVHSQFLSSRAAADLAYQLLDDEKTGPSTSSNGEHSVDSFQIELGDKDSMVNVNVRPGLQDFLEKVTSKYETHVYTAATENYASSVLDTIDPENRLQGRWYRQHCQWDPIHGVFVKALHTLPLENDINRVVLVDNNPMSFLANPDNGILVSSFYNDPSDRTLPLVWDLLQELDDVEDVRPLLGRQFGLRRALLPYLSPPL